MNQTKTAVTRSALAPAQVVEGMAAWRGEAKLQSWGLGGSGNRDWRGYWPVPD